MFAAWLVEENVGFERPETFLAHLPPHRLDAVELGDGWRVVGRMVDAPGGTVRPVDSNVVAHLATQQFVTGHPERLGFGIQQRILDGPERLGHHAARAGSRQAMQLLIDALVLADRLSNDAWRQALDNAAYARRAKAFIEFAPAHHAIAGGELDEVVVAPPRIAGQRLDPRHFRAHVLLPPGVPGRRRKIAPAQGLERATGWGPGGVVNTAHLSAGAATADPAAPGGAASAVLTVAPKGVACHGRGRAASRPGLLARGRADDHHHDGGIVLVDFALGFDGTDQGIGHAGRTRRGVRLNGGENFTFLQRADAVAGEHDHIVRLEAQRAVGSVDQLRCAACQGGTQKMAAGVAARVRVADLARGRQLIELGRQRMILVEEFDLAQADEVERAVANAHPLNAEGAKCGPHKRATHAVEGWMLGDVIGNSGVGEGKGLLETCREGTRGGGHGGKVGLTGERARHGAAGVSTHAVGERQRKLRRAAGVAFANHDFFSGGGAKGGRVLLVAARALTGATGKVERHCYSLRSVSSDQSNSSPQNGTKASCVCPTVITSMALSGTAPVGFLLLMETMLVLARLGTNRNERSTES